MLKPAERALILGADDLGMSASVNEAILAAHDRGVLTSCSLMVAGEAAAAAVAAARERPRLGVGLHLTLVCGRPMLPREQVSRLVGRDGCFLEDPVRAGIRMAFDPEARRQLQSEVEAQFAAFAATGLAMSHVDGHLHFHLHPVVFEIATEQAERHGCRRIRLPRDDLRRHVRATGTREWRAARIAGIFSLLIARAERRLRGRRFRWPRRVYGFLQTGRIDEAYALRLIDELPPGVNEFYFHPDTASGTTGNGPVELSVLLSARVRQALADRGIRRIDYRDLENEACR